MKDYNETIISLVSEGVSDIHFKVFSSPIVRIHGILSRVPSIPPLKEEDMENLAHHILSTSQWKNFIDQSEVDTSFSIPGHFRFRVSLFRQRGSISIVMRIIPFNVPTLTELNLPDVVNSLILAPRGLILVTGVTGSGKSSTLAAMVNEINQQFEKHIITIEDPIEFLHRDSVSAINQREIGLDTDNFADAFKSALRQDPDVILVGELRDIETMEIALRAAETGHLVLSTLHTTDARETINRIIDMFPPHQQKQVRIMLSTNLRAVISQRLLNRADKKGRILATEVMVVNAAIRGFIGEPGKMNEITQNMEKGQQYGMHTFDQSLIELVKNGTVTIDEAVNHASSPNDLKVKLSLQQDHISVPNKPF